MRVFTLPNQLTILRLAFLPALLILIISDRYALALVVLVLAAVTDALDGLLARWLDQRTALGAYLDPIADKLMISSAFVVLALEKRMAWWLTLLVLSRDVAILTTAVVIILVAGYRRFPPSVYGKATTLAENLLVFLVVAGAVFARPEIVRLQSVLVYCVALLTIVSGLHYSFSIARRLHGTT
jgi:cardiolipin synthase (CMP-forming)